MNTNEELKTRLEKATKFISSESFEANEHGQYIYHSDNGNHSINLPYTLVNYVEPLQAENQKLREALKPFQKIVEFLNLDKTNPLIDMEIKNYLHLYVGCDLDTNIPGQYVHPYGHTKITELNINSIHDVLHALEKKERDKKGGYSDSDHIYCRPILRHLSSMTEEECNELDWHYKLDGEKLDHKAENLHPPEIIYLLSKSFDLFKLIENGLAIDLETIKQ